MCMRWFGNLSEVKLQVVYVVENGDGFEEISVVDSVMGLYD